MIKIINRLFTSIILFLISGAAWATDFTQGTAVADHTDLSVGYLGQIFGSVGNVLQGSSGQMLGQLFYKFNEGIVIVAGLWLAYTIFTVVLRSAQEGSFMGANKNVALVFLKIAVGFSLIIPSPSTGYSLLQDLVMEVVVQGVGLADQTWNYGLQYVSNGGSVWHRPEASGSVADATSPNSPGDIVSATTINSILGGPDSTKSAGPGQQIFADEVCMYSSNDNQAQATQNSGNIGPAVGGTPPVQYDVITDDANSQFEFPGAGNPAPIGPGSQNCGVASWNIQNACTGNGSSTTKCTMAKQALQELVTGLQPAAKKYYCSLHSSASSCVGITTTNVASDNEQFFFSSLVNYVNIVVPLVQMNTDNATSAKDFIQEAQTEGWLSAGRYYWDLAQVSTAYDNISTVNTYAPGVTPPNPSIKGNAPYSDANSAAQAAFGYISPVITIVQNYSQTQDAGDTGAQFVPQSADAGISIANRILFGVVTDITAVITDFETAGNGGYMGPDPILFLHKVGMACIGIAGDIWFGYLVGIAIIFFSLGICNAEYNAQGAVAGVLDWIKPILFALAGAFWGVGFILGFYVPMYPYLIYTFGIIGWLIAVIEAMVAAPLVCFGLTHPEGHDFLGEAKQAAMLLLGIFLRPALMVIGLIAGMILSYVSLRLLIYTFSGFASDLFSGNGLFNPASGPANGSILGAAGTLMGHAMSDSTGFSGYILCLLVFPLTLIIFTTLVYTVTTQCFSLIYALPDNVLRWIGAPQQSSHSSEMARQMQGAIGGGSGTFQKGQEAYQQQKMAADQQKKASQLVVNDSPGSGSAPK